MAIKFQEHNSESTAMAIIGKLKRLTACALALLTLLHVACVSAQPATPTFSERDLALARQAMAAAEKSELAYDLVASLTTEVGPRPGGSEGDAKAVAWAVKKLTALGFDRVWAEPVKFDAWKRVSAHADLIAPYHQHLAVTALGNSVSTPAKGISAEVAYYASFDALKADTTTRAKGRIVYIDSVFKRTREGTGYGAAVGARLSGAVEASKRGALAVVIRSVGSDSDRLPHTGTMIYDAKVAPPIPAAAVSTPDGDLIARVAAEGKPMRMFLVMKNASTRNSGSFNVLAEIRGSEKPEQVVAIGGHLDSWDLGTGALDDGAGVAIATATASLLKDLGVRPKRTIRVILFANEENGLFGAKAYAKAHGKEKHQLVSESDLGAGLVYRFNTRADTVLGSGLSLSHFRLADSLF